MSDGFPKLKTERAIKMKLQADIQVIFPNNQDLLILNRGGFPIKIETKISLLIRQDPKVSYKFSRIKIF